MVQQNTAKEPWWGSNLPNDVAAGPDIVVQESQACFGDEIGETHICSCVVASMEWRNRSCCVEKERDDRSF